MNFEDILDKANVKEFIAIVAGLVGENVIDKVTANMDEKQRDLVKVVVGLGGAFAMNELAERNPDYAELLGLAGLGLTALGAKPVAKRIEIQVSQAVGQPVVVREPVAVSSSGIPSTPKKSVVSI